MLGAGASTLAVAAGCTSAAGGVGALVSAATGAAAAGAPPPPATVRVAVGTVHWPGIEQLLLEQTWKPAWTRTGLAPGAAPAGTWSGRLHVTSSSKNSSDSISGKLGSFLRIGGRDAVQSPCGTRPPRS